MLDLHCHIIPAIDDGAQDLDTALKMLAIAQKNGTKAIVATPHVIEGEWLPAWEQILAGCQLLKQEGGRLGLDIPLYPGGEVAIHRDILDIVKGPGAYCINGGRYMLVELPAIEVPGFTEDFIFTLQARGITPVLAHPERHPVLAKDPEILVEWIRRGVLTQINGSSLMGRMGERSRKMAELFLARDMVHCIGSDAHSARNRHPDLSATANRLVELIGRAKAKQLLVVNPQNMLENQDVAVFEIKQLPTNDNTSFFRRCLTKMGI